MALSRVRMTEAMVAGELLRQEVLLASTLQRSTLPPELPSVPGYEIEADFKPASVTGGDTFDVAWLGGEVLVVLADATGHGVPAALSVTQMHAMLRVALAITPDLPAAYRVVNDRLSATLPDGRFVTAFVGLLDPDTHQLRYISGGQGPLLHWAAAEASCRVIRPNCFPMGAMPLPAPRQTQTLALGPGDWIVLLSDGYYEYEDQGGSLLGCAAIQSVIAENAHGSVQAMAAALQSAVDRHARGAPQADDMTRVLLHRGTA
jgi:phosphoserine phosphatase